MQEEALDFSTKSNLSIQSPPINASLSPISPFGHPYFSNPNIEDAHKHLLEQLSPFALLSSSGGMVSGLPHVASMMTNQLLPTTSLALTALHRRRRRISCSEQDEMAMAKKLRSIPEERKDEAYWERRRKNNEAAKRSRDARKSKEDEIAFRAAYLEQENLKLKAQLTMLKSEMTRL